ncbi:MAG: hypothetical protein WCF90_05490 [Methanomicrobiales archaeon]
MEFTVMPGENAIGFGESKCALALNEKLKVYKSMMEILEGIDITKIEEVAFLHQMADLTREQTRNSTARTPVAEKAVPAVKKQKKLPSGLKTCLFFHDYLMGEHARSHTNPHRGQRFGVAGN